MLCSPLRRVDKVEYPRFVQSEACKIFCFKAFTSFYYGGLFLWACYCRSYPGGNLSSFGGDISEALERKKEENRLSREGPADSCQGSEIRDASEFPCPRARAGVVALASLVSEPERASSPLAEVPLVLCSLPSSEPIA